MTLCSELAPLLIHLSNADKYTHHLEGPNSPDPHLELPFHAPHVVELDTFPPAPSRGFPPEEQQLLRHAHCVAVGEVIALDVGPQTGQRNAADNSLVGLTGTVPPLVIVVKTTARMLVLKQVKTLKTHPAVSISIRCCSVVPGSSLFRRPEKMPSCFSNASPAARLTSSISGCEMSRCGGIT